MPDDLVNIEENELKLFVNDEVFDGWKSVSISRSLESVCGSFSITAADRWKRDQDPWQIRALDSVLVKMGKDKIITGFVDGNDVNIGPKTHNLIYNGRDKTCDLVDCSAINDGGEWNKGTTLIVFARALCKPFGIKVIDEVGDKTSNKFAIESGEKVFESLDRAARQRGLIFNSDRNGNLLITVIPRASAVGALVMGENIKEASSSTKVNDRYSLYIVKGQGGGDGKGDWGRKVKIRRQATDPQITRYRPLQIKAEDASNSTQAHTRAHWEANIRAAHATELTVSVRGWRQSIGGPLWDINLLCPVRIPELEVDETLLITGVDFEKSRDGTKTTLKLVQPDYYIPQPKVTVKKTRTGGWR